MAKRRAPAARPYNPAKVGMDAVSPARMPAWPSVASVGGPAFNASGGYVARFDGVTGKFIDKFAPDAKGAMGLAFAPNGDLFVRDYWTTKISRYDGKTGTSVGAVEYPLVGGMWV